MDMAMQMQRTGVVVWAELGAGGGSGLVVTAGRAVIGPTHRCPEARSSEATSMTTTLICPAGVCTSNYY